jgi:hypothetical protein
LWQPPWEVPKLDVAGLNPVSRSIFSMTWVQVLVLEHHLNTIKKRVDYKLLKARDLLRTS